jgi:hypothetical protein
MTTGGHARWTGYLLGSELAQLSPGQPAGMAAGDRKAAESIEDDRDGG